LIAARGILVMLRPRKEPDPLSGKRKLLAEQERLLAERMEQLNRRLANNGEEETGPPKPVEPPVWRLEEDAPVRRSTEPSSMNRRVLARQRQRDMLIFFVMFVALVVLVVLVMALAHTHLSGTLPGS
jgi:hypothetical protein